MTGTSSPSICAERRRRCGRGRRGPLAGAVWVLTAVGVLTAACALAACGDSQPAGGGPLSAGVVAVAAAVERADSGVSSHGHVRPARVETVGKRVMTFVDHSRHIRLPGRAPGLRRLVTVIRYPEHAPGPFPLIVFGHGFAVTPADYSRLLRAWARAGYVVAAPVFPLGNAHAPGGPNEADIVNQPRDMSFVITRMLAASANPRSPLAGLVDRRRIAVSGQSDGGETALAVAYDRPYLDHRVHAAIILSGAELPGFAGFAFPSPSPPLLAVQGTADTTNDPRNTYAFFAMARRPKYLLKLLGARHLAPYTDEQPQLSIVERVSIAFLDRYLEHAPTAISRMVGAGDVAGRAAIVADP